MKHYYFISFIVFLFLLSGCSKPKKPNFQKVKSVEAIQIDKNKITVEAVLLFTNPNGIGGYVQQIAVDVKANNLDVGKVLTTKGIKIPAKNEFEVPFKVDLPYDDLRKSEKGLINQVIASLFLKKVLVEYEGIVTFEFLGSNLDVPFSHQEEVKLFK